MFSEMCHLSCIFHGFFGRDKAQVCLPKAVSYHDLLAKIIFFSFPLVQKVTYIFCQNLKWQLQINKTLSVEDIIKQHFFDKLLLLYSLFLHAPWQKEVCQLGRWKRKWQKTMKEEKDQRTYTVIDRKKRRVM